MRIAFTLLIFLALTTSSLAGDHARQKVIDFDGDTVEGMNKRPLDSLNQISEKNKRRHTIHLYRKRAGFRSETAETIRGMRYTQ